jgi:hypothetical protein
MDRNRTGGYSVLQRRSHSERLVGFCCLGHH